MYLLQQGIWLHQVLAPGKGSVQYVCMFRYYKIAQFSQHRKSWGFVLHQPLVSAFLNLGILQHQNLRLARLSQGAKGQDLLIALCLSFCIACILLFAGPSISVLSCVVSFVCCCCCDLAWYCVRTLRALLGCCFSRASTCLSTSRLPRAFPPFHYIIQARTSKLISRIVLILQIKRLSRPTMIPLLEL